MGSVNENKVGNKIREARKKAGLTMTALAKKVGVSYLTIYRIETGKVSPSVALLSEIAHCLNKPITSFFDEKRGEMTIIKSSEQPVAQSEKLAVRLLAPKGLINNQISISLGKAEKGEFVGRHKTNGFEFSYIIRGSCLFRYGNTDYKLEQGDLVYFDGGTWHSVTALEPLEFLAIYFRNKD